MKGTARFFKRDLGFFPVDRDARQMIANVPEGSAVFMQVWKPRNMRQHDKYFALLDRVVEASGQWASRAALEFEIAWALKAGDFVELRGGKKRFEPWSRAVASMPRAEFERLYDDTMKLLTEWLGCDPEMLLQEAA